jgi:hypothetical protein
MESRISFSEAEKILSACEDQLQRLRKIGIEKNPAPPVVIKDGAGKRLDAYTIRDFFAKIDEEVNEFKAAVLSFYDFNDNPTDYAWPDGELRRATAGEACDAITAITNACRYMHIDDAMLSAEMHNTAVKLEDRGYLDD